MEDAWEARMTRMLVGITLGVLLGLSVVVCDIRNQVAALSLRPGPAAVLLDREGRP